MFRLGVDTRAERGAEVGLMGAGGAADGGESCFVSSIAK